MTRVAAVDCGTNSIRLLVADVSGSTQTDLVRLNTIVRLGQGVDRTGVLAEDALERTGVALADYALEVERLGAERIRMVATSATRDAANRSVFVDLVQAALGVDPEVITGAQEAALSFAGATRALAPTGPVLVCDIGGGSTELVRGLTSVQASLSVDVGCVRLSERHGSDWTAIEADATAAVGRLVGAVPVAGASQLLGLAGTATTVTALALGLPAYDPEAIHLSEVSLVDVERVTDRLMASTRAEIAALPVVHPGRVDVITSGAIILRAVVRAVDLGGFTASEADILDGIVWSLV